MRPMLSCAAVASAQAVEGAHLVRKVECNALDIGLWLAVFAADGPQPIDLRQTVSVDTDVTLHVREGEFRIYSAPVRWTVT